MKRKITNEKKVLILDDVNRDKRFYKKAKKISKNAGPNYKKGGTPIEPTAIDKLQVVNGMVDVKSIVTILEDLCFNSNVNSAYLYQENDELEYHQQERNYGKADGICWVVEDLEKIIDKLKKK